MKLKKCVFIGLLSFLLFAAFGSQPVYAIDKSRIFISLLFFSGLGCGAVGSVWQNEANEIYDDYMHTAVGAEQDRLYDDYEQRYQESTDISRAGLGLVAGAVLLSLIDAAYIQAPEVQKAVIPSGSEFRAGRDQVINLQTENGDIFLAIGSGF